MNTAGIDAAVQRIREIQERLKALEAGSQDGASRPELNTFGQILNGKIQDGSAGQKPDVAALESLIESEASAIGLDPNLAKAVTKAESGFNPNAVSPAGAKGLMQLMPSTAQSLGVQAVLNPVENVRGGTRYLHDLVEKYHSIPTALAAYNAGPGTVDKYGGIPPYKETQNYVQTVLNYQRQYEQNNGED